MPSWLDRLLGPAPKRDPFEQALLDRITSGSAHEPMMEQDLPEPYRPSYREGQEKAEQEQKDFFVGPIEPLARAGKRFADEVTAPNPEADLFLGRIAERAAFGGHPVAESLGVGPKVDRLSDIEAETLTGPIKGAIGGAVQGLSEVPSPVDAVTLPLSLAAKGVGMAGRGGLRGAKALSRGAEVLGKTANVVDEVADLGTMGAGAIGAVEAGSRGDYADVAGSLALAGMGGLGLAAGRFGGVPEVRHPNQVDTKAPPPDVGPVELRHGEVEPPAQNVGEAQQPGEGVYDFLARQEEPEDDFLRYERESQEMDEQGLPGFTLPSGNYSEYQSSTVEGAHALFRSQLATGARPRTTRVGVDVIDGPEPGSRILSYTTKDGKPLAGALVRPDGVVSDLASLNIGGQSGGRVLKALAEEHAAGRTIRMPPISIMSPHSYAVVKGVFDNAGVPLDPTKLGEYDLTQLLASASSARRARRAEQRAARAAAPAGRGGGDVAPPGGVEGGARTEVGRTDVGPRTPTPVPPGPDLPGGRGTTGDVNPPDTRDPRHVELQDKLERGDTMIADEVNELIRFEEGRPPDVTPLEKAHGGPPPPMSDLKLKATEDAARKASFDKDVQDIMTNKALSPVEQKKAILLAAGKHGVGLPAQPTGKPRGKRGKRKKLPEHDLPTMIKQRQAAQLGGAAKRQKFEKSGLRQGLGQMLSYEKNPNANPQFQELKSFFDEWHKKLNDYGVKVDYRTNYLTHLWENTTDEVKAAYKRMGIQPGFTQARIFETLRDGIAAGLKPKYTNLSDVAGWYEARARKAIANRGYFNYGKQNKKFKLKNTPKDWVDLPSRYFPSAKTKVKGQPTVLPYKTDPETFRQISNYFEPRRRFWDGIINRWNDVKNMVLTGGIPMTGFNLHGYRMLKRVGQIQPNVVKGKIEQVKQLRNFANPKRAEREFRKNIDNAVELVEEGMTLNVEEHPFHMDQKTTGEKVRAAAKDLGMNLKKGHVWKGYHFARDMHKALFEDPLFGYVLPNLKAEYGIKMRDELVAAGKSKKEANQFAAQAMNDIFGGQNTEAMLRDKDFQDFLRFSFVAPDWMESNIRTGAKAVGSLKPSNWGKAEYKIYRNAIQNLAVTYVMATMVNKLASGKFMHENPENRDLSIAAGKTETGRGRFMRTTAYESDWARLPLQIAEKAAKKDFSGLAEVIGNRVHPMLQGIIALAVTNRNYRGQPITGAGLPVKTQLSRVGSELASVATPSYVQAAVDAASSGEKGTEEFLAKALETPLQYSKEEKGQGHRRRGTQRRRSR